MLSLVNGQFSEQIPTNDRGFLYGQSVYETIGIVNGKARLLDEHLSRLTKGTKTLSIPFNINDIERDIQVISNEIAAGENRILRIAISMAGGGRGYQNPSPSHSNRTLQLSAYPSFEPPLYVDGIKLGLTEVRLSHQPLLAGLKHGNRLEQILARQQWQDHWQEALVLDQAGNVVEGTQSNVFVVKKGAVFTPKLDQCGVEGVMKQWVQHTLKHAGFSCQAVRLSVQQVEEADEVFMTNSLIGVWPVASFRDKRYSKRETAHQLIEQLFQNEIIPHY